MTRSTRTVTAHTKGGVPTRMRIAHHTENLDRVELPRNPPTLLGYLGRPRYIGDHWRTHTPAENGTGSHTTRAAALTALHTQHLERLDPLI